LDIDLVDLERRFHELSRRFHPDYFQRKSDQERAISLENSALINTAYRTLRDPIQRAEYLVRLEEGAAKPIPAQAPSDLFEEILELQEGLEEYQVLKKTGRSNSEELRQHVLKEQEQLKGRKETLEKELLDLFKSWDDLGSAAPQETRRRQLVGRMKEILSHRNYLETVLRDIEKAFG
jgi:molecular chaperone HscB